MKKYLGILFALVLALSFSLVTAVPAGASPGSYSTNMGKACWTVPVDFTDESGLNWDPLEVEVTYADGQATFVITPPVAFNPEAPNDNFWLVFDADNDGVEDFQVLYNTRLPSEDPSQTYDFHWAKKTYNGGWSDYQVIPEDWTVSETDLEVFTVSIPVSYLGGLGSDYGFQIGLVKYVPMSQWDASWGIIPWDPPTCGEWSTQALIFVPLPSEGWESETIQANTSVGMVADAPEITAISVTPTSIDFGTIKPGDTVPTPAATITVENVGTVTVDVDASLDPLTGTVFNYLQLGGAYSPAYSGIWDDIVKSLLPSKSHLLSTQLVVPSTYSAKGVEEAMVTFIAEAK